MLRIGFMPSDFYPVLLVLGEHGDLVDFGDILAAFAETGGERALTGDGASGKVMISLSSGPRSKR